MKYQVLEVPQDVWNEKYAKNAHISVFEEGYNPDEHSCDFALLVSKDDTLISYSTIKNLTPENVCMEYGGSFPTHRGSTHVLQTFLVMLDYLKQKGKKEVYYVTTNENYPMLKFGLFAGFKITGMTLSKKGKLLLEHSKNLLEE